MEDNLGPSERQMTHIWMDKHGLSQSGQDLLVNDFKDQLVFHFRF